MELLKKYGKTAAKILLAAGLLLSLYAWHISPKSFIADIWVSGMETPVQVKVNDLIAANWLQDAGVRLFPGDAIYYSGVEIEADFRLPAKQDQTLTYRMAVPVTVNHSGEQYTFYSSAATLGAALWEQQIELSASDTVSLPLTTPLTEPLAVEIYSAKLITILVDDVQVEVSTAAATIGEALADAGVALQGLDMAEPAEDQPLPEDGVIEVTRVREETLLEESAVAYSEVRVADAEMLMGEEEVTQTGENGIQVSSVRVRYENDEEVSREVEQQWISLAPVDQIIAYGSQVNVQTSADAECYVDYYLAKEVYVTSYLDTGQTTASGIWPYYGVIAVSPEWYSILKGSSICVPGYGVGTVLDVCPGCSGKAWLDVFIPTDSYVPWSKNLTAYFMTPVPSGFTGDLP